MVRSIPNDPIVYRANLPSAFPLDRWQKACEVPGRGVNDMELLRELMGLYARMPAGEITHREVPVWLVPGKSIKAHRHPEYTGLYYPDPQGVAVILGDERVSLEPWDFLVIAPNVLHAVEKNEGTGTRLSIALRVGMKEGEDG